MKEKGVKLTLDLNDKEYISALQNIRTEANKLRDQLKDIKTAFKFNPKDGELYAEYVRELQIRMNSLYNESQKLKQKLEEVPEGSRKWFAIQATIAQLGNDFNSVKKELDSAKKSFEEANNPVSTLAKSFENAKKEASIFFENLKANLVSDIIKGGFNLIVDSVKAVGRAIADVSKGYFNLIKQGVEYNALIQGYSTTLKAYLGDNGEITDKFIKDVRQIGVQFGFANDNLLEMAQTLVISGVSVEDTKQMIESVVSSLSVVGKGNAELSRVSANLLQIQTNGKATARDLREFANAGIPIYKLLADYSEEFKGDFKATEVEFEDILGAFTKAMQDGNNILSQAGEIRQQTFAGQVDQLSARWQEFLGIISLDTTNTLTTDVLPAINEFLSSIIASSDEGFEGMEESFTNGLSTLIGKITDSGIIEDFLEGANLILESIGKAFNPGDPQGRKNLDALNKLIKTMCEGIVNFLTSEPIKTLFVTSAIEVANAFADAFIDTVYQRIVDANIEKFAEGAAGADYGDYWDNQGGGSLGFGDLASTGYSRTANVTINVNNNGQFINENTVRSWANIINEELGAMV